MDFSNTNHNHPNHMDYHRPSATLSSNDRKPHNAFTAFDDPPPT